MAKLRPKKARVSCRQLPVHRARVNHRSRRPPMTLKKAARNERCEPSLTVDDLTFTEMIYADVL